MSLVREFEEIGSRMSMECASLQDVLRIPVSDEALEDGIDSRIYTHCLNKTDLAKLFSVSKPTINKRLEEAIKQGLVGEPIFQNKQHLYTRNDIHALKEAWGCKRYSDDYNSAVIAVENHKGGTGKSTSSALLATASALDLDDYSRVLLIDFDPQGSQAINLKLRTSDSEDDEQIYLTMIDLLLSELEPDGTVSAYLNEGYTISQLVDAAPVKAHLPNLDVFPAFTTDDRFTDLFWQQDEDGQHRLLTRFREEIVPLLKERYDLIFIDTPPQDSPITWAINEAVDGLFIPVTAHEFDFASTSNYMNTLARNLVNLPSKGENIKFFRVGIVNFDDQSRSDKQILNKMIRSIRERLLTTQLLHSELFLEAALVGCTVLDIKKSHSKTPSKQFDRAIQSSKAFHLSFMNEIKMLTRKDV